jgi:hypothetical protein
VLLEVHQLHLHLHPLFEKGDSDPDARPEAGILPVSSEAPSSALWCMRAASASRNTVTFTWRRGTSRCPLESSCRCRVTHLRAPQPRSTHRRQRRPGPSGTILLAPSDLSILTSLLQPPTSGGSVSPHRSSLTPRGARRRGPS